LRRIAVAYKFTPAEPYWFKLNEVEVPFAFSDIPQALKWLCDITHFGQPEEARSVGVEWDADGVILHLYYVWDDRVLVGTLTPIR
jgi:hypothetical protein